MFDKFCSMFVIRVVQECAKFVDLEKCYSMRICLKKIGLDTSENEPSKVFQNYGVLNGSARGMPQPRTSRPTLLRIC